MEKTALTYLCPDCMAYLRFDGKESKWVCDYCGGYDVIHTCGPRPMMAAVAALAKEYGVKCEVSMEERMACGVGACHGCICKTLFKSNEGIEGEHYRRVCVDGPVFDAEEIVW